MYRDQIIFVLIPAFNEARTIGKVISEIPSFVDRIIVVDDGSSDGTAEVAAAAGAEVICHHVNLGVGAGFRTGVDHVLAHQFDILVNMDGDGQFATTDIPALIEPLIEGSADFVTGSRLLSTSQPVNMPWIKRWGNRRMAWLIGRLTRCRFHDVSCGFRAYSRETVLRLNLAGSFTYTQETFIDLANKRLRIKEVPVTVTYFPGRRSRVAGSILRYALLTSRTIFRSYRDYRPLSFFWSIAAVFLGLALFFSSILAWHRLTTGVFSGHIWAGFAGGFFFVFALAFFLLGIIGDILLRIRMNQETIIYRLKKTAMPLQPEGEPDR